MKLKYKLWLEGEGRLFGDGPCNILQLVKRLGSLRRAASEINMSYSQAWELIKNLEARLGFKLLESRSGGIAGGGSIVTAKGEHLMETYISFRREAAICLTSLANKWFDDQFEQGLGE